MEKSDIKVLGGFIIAVAVAALGPATLADIDVGAHDSEVIAGWITAVATSALAGLAAFQFRSLVRTSNADFIHKLNGDFYTNEARPIRVLLDNPELKFIAKDGGAFAIGEKTLFISEELDDRILGPLEAIGIFLQNGAIDMSTTYEMFGRYAILLWEKKVIADYIDWLRKEPSGQDVYDQMEKLYRRCKEYEADKLGLH